MEFVTLADGVRLHVETQGPSDPTLPRPRATVVLVHGWTLSKKTWAKVSANLGGEGDIQVVAYDHRGHGRSDAVSQTAGTIGQVAHDLFAVLKEICPVGPVILAGHSLGGMAILALADARPEMFDPRAGGRVVGVVLINTSAGGPNGVSNGIPLGQTRFGRALVRRALFSHAKRRSAPKRKAESPTRPRGARAAVLKWLLTGTDATSEVVTLALRMVEDTPAASFPAFLETFLTHDRRHAFAHLQGIPVTILAGSQDRLTPVAEATAMAALVPNATLRVLPLAGHMLPLERENEVSAAIIEVLARTCPPAFPTTDTDDLASSHGVKSRS